MMAATLSQFPSFFFFPSLISHKLVYLVPHQPLKLRWTSPPQHPVHFAAVRSSSSSSLSVKKSRRKAKSNEELCDELRQFVAAVGLPEGHIPSMKDLSQNGRNDLAYIVRRRGYKLIKKLLTDLSERESSHSGGNADNFLADAINDDQTHILLTGQDQEVDHLGSDSDSLVSEAALNHDDSVHVPVESSADTLLQDGSSGSLESCSGQVDNVDGNSHADGSKIVTAFNSDNEGYIATDSSLGVLEDSSLPATDSVKEKNSGSSNIGWDDPNPHEHSTMPVECWTNWSSDKRSEDAEVGSMAEEISLSTKVSATDEEHHSSLDLEPIDNSGDNSYTPGEPPENLSLEEKVTNFMQNGDLDTIEEIETPNEFGGAEEVQPLTPASELTQTVLSGSDAHSKSVLSSTVVDLPLRDASSADEGPNSLSDKDVKKSEREDDISRLKFMLHQKELELFRLKEQIEKEQHALSVLQANAESVISEAQKLVSEKDAELLAAEESLSGLVEVEIQYRGDGEIVEVTGSFNGWHHQIKLDPQSSSSIIDHVGLRQSRLWSTRLWLYPGVYEIKFIVDGQWTLDPERESVTVNTICNNILRVEG